jgi:hypothetical protein
MRVALLWFVLAISGELFVHMLLALRNCRARNTVLTYPRAAAEYGWTTVPWLIIALVVAPAVQRIFAAG